MAKVKEEVTVTNEEVEEVTQEVLKGTINAEGPRVKVVKVPEEEGVNDHQ